MQNLTKIVADLDRWEGTFPWMYVDTKGYVTTGIGHLLRTAADAQKLPWLLQVPSATAELPRATPAQVAADFARIAAAPPAKLASYYAKLSPLRLTLTFCRELAETRLDREFLPKLRTMYPGFDDFPEAAQDALIDMAWNLGTTGLGKFSHLAEAVRRRNWRAAAESCSVKGGREERNAWRQQMFKSAAAAGA